VGVSSAAIPEVPRKMTAEDDVLGGGEVLPGFSLPLPDLFVDD
jgi:hypothetical protein